MSAARSLLQVVNGTEDFHAMECEEGFNSMEEIPALATIVYGLTLIWLFFALHLLCEHYFIHAITSLVRKLELREDVAGATLMAVGSSLPEVLANFVDVFGRSNNLGASTIVGSCLFNVLGGVGYAMVRTHSMNAHLSLDWLPVLRDTVFWIIGALALLLVFRDGKCELAESAVFVTLYVLYVLIIVFFPKLRKMVGVGSPQRRPSVIWREKQEAAAARELNEQENTYEMQEMSSPDKVKISVGHDVAVVLHPQSILSDANLDAVARPEAQVDQTNPQAGTRWYPRLCMGIYKVTSYPLKILFYFIPDCSEETGKPDLWPATLGLSLLVMVGVVFAIMELGNRIGCVLGLHPTVVGATILAVGTSMPDVLSSTAAAKLGLIGMSTSNAIGSNVFNIYFALGFPWLVYHLANPNESIPVSNDNLIGPVVWMLCTAVFTAALIGATKWKFTLRVGVILLTLYGAFVIYALVVHN